MRRILTTAFLVLPLACAAADSLSSAKVYEHLQRRVAELPVIWPGFDPARLPVAIYDGDATQLFTHPAPPDEFVQRNGEYVFQGRHPAVASNSSHELGGTLTATVMPFGSGMTASERAAVVAHELFHVFQREHHPTWAGNEAEYFSYPFDDSVVMSSRAFEDMALRNALAASDDEARCLAAAAMQARARRYEHMQDVHVAYERLSELNEGLARYVQILIAGGDSSVELMPAKPFPPAGIRDRVYATGAAMALLLDRFLADWKVKLDAEAYSSLDALLQSALPATGCPADATARQRAEELAEAALAVFAKDLAAKKAEYLRAPGRRIVIRAGSEPLWPQRFDPLNVAIVGAGEVLHSRYLVLGNGAGKIELVGRGALTVAAGEHPIFGGVREVVLTGVPAEGLRIDADGLVIRSSVLTADFTAKVTQDGEAVLVQLP
jgi:hypothetical protein